MEMKYLTDVVESELKKPPGKRYRIAPNELCNPEHRGMQNLVPNKLEKPRKPINNKTYYVYNCKYPEYEPKNKVIYMHKGKYEQRKSGQPVVVCKPFFYHLAWFQNPVWTGSIDGISKERNEQYEWYYRNHV
jgi:hypothetical protein